MPLAWPVSVPPVRLIAQPVAPLSVLTPSTVAELIWSNEVQVALFRSEQPPLDDQLIPAARNFAVAWAWVSLANSPGPLRGAAPAVPGEPGAAYEVPAAATRPAAASMTMLCSLAAIRRGMTSSWERGEAERGPAGEARQQHRSPRRPGRKPIWYG